MTTSTQADPSTGPAIDHDCPLRVAVLTGSVRGERLSRTLAGWAADRIEVTGAAADLIDLAEHRLPDDELLQPGGGPRSEIADRIEHADAFVVVTPEYNHSYPGSLKRAIDWHYDEWAFKPATVLSYGVQGGLLATEHLRGVFAELHVVTTRRVVGLRGTVGGRRRRRVHPGVGGRRGLRRGTGRAALVGRRAAHRPPRPTVTRTAHGPDGGDRADAVSTRAGRPQHRDGGEARPSGTSGS